jgi:hypothetical protein
VDDPRPLFISNQGPNIAGLTLDDLCSRNPIMETSLVSGKDHDRIDQRIQTAQNGNNAYQLGNEKTFKIASTQVGNRSVSFLDDSNVHDLFTDGLPRFY